MPIVESHLLDEKILKFALIGDVTGDEYVEWRLALSTRFEMARYDMVIDLLSYTGSIEDDDLMRLLPVARERRVDSMTIVATTDGLIPLWLESLAIRAAQIAPRHDFRFFSTVEEGLDHLRAARRRREAVGA